MKKLIVFLLCCLLFPFDGLCETGKPSGIIVRKKESVKKTKPYPASATRHHGQRH